MRVMKFRELVPKAPFIQGIATSIDALSVGFTISEYDWLMALVCSPDHCHSHILYLHDRTFPLKTLPEPGFPTRRIFSAASFLLYQLHFFLQLQRAISSEVKSDRHTMVSPTRVWLPSSIAILLAVSTVRSPPKAIAAAPTIVKENTFAV